MKDDLFESRSSLGSEMMSLLRREDNYSPEETEDLIIENQKKSPRSSSLANSKIRQLRHQVLALQTKREEGVREAVSKDR